MKKNLGWIAAIAFIIGCGFSIIVTACKIKVKIERELSATYHELDSLRNIESKKATINRTLQVAYPQLSIYEVLAYGELFYYVCEVKYKVSWIPPGAVMGVESNSTWNPTLISSAKCRGLGQLGSAAAKEGCDKLGIPYKEGYTEWIEPLNLGLALDYYCSRAKAKGDSFAVRAYIGGDTWPKAVPEGSRDKYIKKYAEDVAAKELKIRNVLTETIKLDYIYKGVSTETQNAKPVRLQGGK